MRGGWVVRFFSGLPLALSNDRGLAPAPPRQSAREVPTCPNKAVGAAARRLGRLSRFPTALQPPPPRRGACAIIVPIKRLNCRCPSARRRWRWAVRLRNGFSVGTGATRAAMPPKTERGGSVPNEFAPNLPRSVFRLWRASPPCPMKSGRFCAQHTATPAGAAPRAAFGYSRANGDSTRTLRGRSARGARIGRPSIGGASGHFKHEGGRRARRGRCLGRGKNSAGSGDSLEIVHLFSKRIGDAWREASRRIAAGARQKSGLRGKTANPATAAKRGRTNPSTAAKRRTQRPRQNAKPNNRGKTGGFGGTWRCVATRGKHSRA